MSEWVAAATLADFESTDRRRVDLGDREIALVHSENRFFAVSAWCSHERYDLLDGAVEGTEIECCRHGARFDLETGKPLSLPAVRPIDRYDVKVEGETIYIRI